MKKLLVAGVIILFLCVGIAPSIHANIQKETLDGDLVEFSTDICGLHGNKQNKVQLTQEQAEEIDRLFKRMKTKLNNYETRETTIKIFSLSGEMIRKIKPGECEVINKKHCEIQWDGRNKKGEIISSGIYIYTYKSPKERGTGKFTVIAR